MKVDYKGEVRYLRLISDTNDYALISADKGGKTKNLKVSLEDIGLNKNDLKGKLKKFVK